MDELYQFRDFYFDTRGLEDAALKQNDVLQEMEKTLMRLQENEGDCKSFSEFQTCSFLS